MSRIIWIRGIPPIDFWIRREAVIAKFVKDNDLKPIDTAVFQMEGVAAGVPEVRGEKAVLAPRRPPFPGGMRMPHLHFKGEVFGLSEQQWQSFSGGVIKDLQAKLSKVSGLSFDQTRDIAEGIDRIG